MTRTIFGLAASILLAACSGPDDGAQCDGELDLAVTSPVPATVSGDLVIRGTASTTRNVAVRSVTVGGIDASADSFNYRTWSATVPFSTLLAMPGTGDDIEVPIEAAPSCGGTGSHSLSVHLERHPEIQVSDLTLAVAFPASRTYLPADGSASAVVTLTGDPSARGATVVVNSSGAGRFEGGTDSATLVLAGDDTSAAMTTALLTATEAGSIFVTATSRGIFATPLAIPTASAPRLVPDAAGLAPGQSIAVSLLAAQAQAVTCDVVAEKGLSVTKHADGSGYDLVAAATLTDAAHATITCRDGYGQTSAGSYTVAPPAP